MSRRSTSSWRLPLRSFAGLDLTGNWQCRTIKLGGIGDLVIYDWFKCRVTDDGSGWRLEKLTGSQRMAGRFYDDGDKRMIYLGSFFIAGDPIKPYGSGPETDQVGYAFRTGAEDLADRAAVALLRIDSRHGRVPPLTCHSRHSITICTKRSGVVIS